MFYVSFYTDKELIYGTVNFTEQQVKLFYNNVFFTLKLHVLADKTQLLRCDKNYTASFTQLKYIKVPVDIFNLG